MAEDTYTTGEAARILRVSVSRVRQMLGSGELEGNRDTKGQWSIPQRAVHARMERTPRPDPLRAWARIAPSFGDYFGDYKHLFSAGEHPQSGISIHRCYKL